MYVSSDYRASSIETNSVQYDLGIDPEIEAQRKQSQGDSEFDKEKELKATGPPKEGAASKSKKPKKKA